MRPSISSRRNLRSGGCWNPRRKGFCSAFVLAAAVGVVVILCPPVTALDRSVGPEGAQIAIVKRALTFGLDGTNVRIGQIEGTGEPRTTHAALAGAIIVRGVGPANSNHATGVAGILIGRPFTPVGGPEITGVASGARLWSTWFADTIGVDDFFRSTNWLTGNAVEIINMSDFLRAGAVATGSMFVDHVVANRDVIWVKSAGNGGPGAGTITPPGDAFNAIAVGAVGADNAGNDSEDYTRVANYSSRGPVDGRRKPDIVAPARSSSCPPVEPTTPPR